MRKIIGKILLSFLGVSLMAGLFTAAPLVTPEAGDRSYVSKLETLVAPTPAEASGTNHSRFWVYTGTGGPGGYSSWIRFCRDWYSGTWSYSTSDTICGPKATLSRGMYTYSTLQWHDTDGFYVRSGMNVYTSIIINNAPDGLWAGKYETGWHKKGGCNWCLRKAKQV